MLATRCGLAYARSSALRSLVCTALSRLHCALPFPFVLPMIVVRPAGQRKRLARTSGARNGNGLYYTRGVRWAACPGAGCSVGGAWGGARLWRLAGLPPRRQRFRGAAVHGRLDLG